MTGILQFILMFENLRGVTYDIETFELAPDTIRSAKTVEDTVKTEERAEAERSVEPVYVFNKEAAEHKRIKLYHLFLKLFRMFDQK
ncbi:HD domain-containing protein OS=Ureibacillus acetophenoni OX=614649 GN=SAMN05877842_102245 PE=4 SV=1 [Ureibacillus acetophenoni]